MPHQPQNILITGAAGFSGGHAALYLAKKYPHYKIVCMDKLNLTDFVEFGKQLMDLPNVKFIKGNVLSPDLITFVFETENIDTVCHFAHTSHIEDSFGHSFQFTENNTMGTHVLLEASKNFKIERFIHISTDEVYGSRTPGTAGAEETAVLAPTNPFAASKAAAEYLVKAYYRSFKLPVIIFRGNNVFGPGQFPEHLIPKSICLLERGEACFVHGTGKDARAYVYYTDACRAFDLILHKGSAGEVYNVGSDKSISNVDVVRTLLRLFGLAEREEEFIRYVAGRSFADIRHPLNPSKLHAMGWKQEVDFETGLRETIEWYRKNLPLLGELKSVLTAHPRGAPKNSSL